MASESKCRDIHFGADGHVGQRREAERGSHACEFMADADPTALSWYRRTVMAKGQRRKPRDAASAWTSSPVVCITCSTMLAAVVGSLIFAGFSFSLSLEMQPGVVVAGDATGKALSQPAGQPASARDEPHASPSTTSTTGLAPMTTKDLQAAPLPKDSQQKCTKVAFLRIQKTASTTFGQEIMSKMCGKTGQICSRSWERCARGMGKCSLPFGYYHLEYRYAREFVSGPGRGCVVTFLRDPVERIMSEYFMLREKHRQFLTFDQWDVHAADLPDLDSILGIKDVHQSFHQYLQHPGNPSRNRQTLYLLGFQRVRCNVTRCGGDACICEQDDSGYPSKAYKWDEDGAVLLENAKDHLRTLDAFGITDCFDQSIKVIAPALGWDAEAALKLAKDNHALHVWRPVMEKARQIRPSGSARLFEGQRRLSFNGPGSNFWREFLHDDVRKEILAVNRLDADLLIFARKHFKEKHGIECTDEA
ncbi:hypothetical protein AK812_SmicGene29847 [Symbiodinium microadriaticum]|uniref:Sulfotransferase domain-containing protein n=1 Tax=Symbiodinium microadriaticum TaxID=2951 RepID=A0A1Q9D0R1_SYMMI|nr:hypothetical protein AK812_SmicGene29847 [Symbiodinium microadriaticum]